MWTSEVKQWEPVERIVWTTKIEPAWHQIIIRDDDGQEVAQTLYVTTSDGPSLADALSLASAITRLQEYHELALDVVRLADRNTDAGKRMFEAAVAVLRPIDRK